VLDGNEREKGGEEGRSVEGEEVFGRSVNVDGGTVWWEEPPSPERSWS
jgi:hypothetical protein